MSLELKEPEKLELPEEVKIAATMGRLTFFIGNGVSRLYGVPSWDELANKMLQRLADCGKLNHSLFGILSNYPTKVKISIADYYFKENNVKNEYSGLSYQNILMDGIKKEDIHKKIPVYKLIADCNVKLITTNYDGLLSDVLSSPTSNDSIIPESKLNQSQKAENNQVGKIRNFNYATFKSLEEFEESSLVTNNFLVHLHGSIADENTLIASTSSYLELYRDKRNQDKLNLLFKNQTVVFIGYSLEELEILDLIIRTSTPKTNNEESPKFFLVLSLLSHEKEILKHLRIYYSQLGVTLLPYSRDQKGYLALTDVLEKWTRELQEIIQQPSRVDHQALLDDLSKKFFEASL